MDRDRSGAVGRITFVNRPGVAPLGESATADGTNESGDESNGGTEESGRGLDFAEDDSDGGEN